MSEIIEYKSSGHPDTLTDLVVEQCATMLDFAYKDQYGRVLHYNVDKALFLAGKARIIYGGGRVLKEPCFILGGQASKLTPTLRGLLSATVRQTVHKYLPNLKAFDVEVRTNIVSDNLEAIAESPITRCNDTSLAVGYWPPSKAESVVLDLIQQMNREVSLQSHAPLGELYKILMTDDTVYISCPLYAREVANCKVYSRYKKALERFLYAGSRHVILNPDFSFGFPYMTLCGSSIECGDDGQVGRGNRYNGLITPCRPMTMEAYCGKNNHNHIGKLYQKLALETAKEFYERTGGYTEIMLIGKIGTPITSCEMYVNGKKHK